MLKRMLAVGVICAASLSTSGCFLQAVLGRTVTTSISEFVDQIFAALEADAATAVCRQETVSGATSLDCQYVIGGLLATSTATLVSELGIFGVIVDPLVLELPESVTGIHGTYDDQAGHSGDLIVYPGLSFVPVADGETLTPGPGRQLVILQLPEGVPVEGLGYRFHLAFQQQVPAGTGGPVAVKSLFTGRVESRDSPGKVYYPPLLPCETDLANVPSITLPESATLEPLALPMNAAGCMNRVYTYFHFSPACDLDNDTDVDRDDYRLILGRRNTAADTGDPRDINGDGVINLLDARTCVLQCTRARCAT